MSEIVIGLIVSIVVSVVTAAISYALRPDPPKQDQRRRQTFRDLVRENSAPARVIYGEMRVSGVLAYAISTKADGVERDGAKYLHMCVLICEGPIDSMRDLQLNDIDLNDPDPVAREKNRTRFKNNVRWFAQLGEEDQRQINQSANYPGEGESARQSRLLGAVNGSTGPVPQVYFVTSPVKLPNEWTRGHVDKNPQSPTYRQTLGYHDLKGIAYLWCVFKFDQEKFPSGAPNIRVTVKGRKVWDPRQDAAFGGTGAQSLYDPNTWTWSDNWTLCVLDYMMNNRFGMKIPLDQIDIAAAIEDADYCDELVTIYGSDGQPLKDTNGNDLQEKRYRMGGVFETNRQPADIMDDMKRAAAGDVLRLNGKYVIRSGRPSTPVGTITEKDLRDNIEVLPHPGRKDRCNTVRGIYVAPGRISEGGKNWQDDAYPQVQDEAAVYDDGGELVDQYDQVMVQSIYQAQRNAAVYLRQKRQDMTVRLPTNFKGLKYLPKDVVYAKSDALSWTALNGGSGKKFRVEDVRFSIDGGSDLECLEYDDSVFDLSTLVMSTEDPAPNSTLPGPFSIDPVRDLVVTAGAQKDSTGRTLGKITATWIAPDEDALVDHYLVQYQHVDDALPQERETKQTSIELLGLRQGSWNVTVYAVSQIGVKSAPRTRGVSIDFHVLPPADVQQLLFQVDSNDLREYSWRVQEIVTLDYKHFEIRYLEGEYGDDPDAEWAQARLLVRVPPQMRFREGNHPRRPGTYTFYIKAVDQSGLESDHPAFVVATIPDALNPGLVYSEEFSEDDWPGTVRRGLRNEVGEIEGTSSTTWDDLPATWDEWTSWVINSDPILYEHRIIELGRTIDLVPEAQVQALGAPFVQMRVRRAGVWSNNQPLQRAIGDAFIFSVQVRPTADITVPVLRRCRVTMREQPLVEVWNDIDTAQIAGKPPVGTGQDLSRSPWNRFTGAIVDLRYDESGYRERLQSGEHYNTLITPPTGSAVVLEAANDPCVLCGAAAAWVSVPDHAALRLTAQWSIELALAAVTHGATGKVLLAKGTDYRVLWDAGTVTLAATGYSGSNPAIGSEIVVPDDGCWHTITYSYDGHTLRKFLDGVEYGVAPAQFVFAVSGVNLSIGSGAGGTNPFEGYVEEVSIWNRPLSIEEAVAGHDIRRAGTESGIAGSWALGDGTSTTARDTGSHALHGTVSSSSFWRRFATRLTAAVDLGVVRALVHSTIRWSETAPAGTSVAVAVSVDGGVTFAAATNGGAVPAVTRGSDLQGKSIVIRTQLTSTDPTKTAQIGDLIATLISSNVTGEFSVPATQPFAYIDDAAITAIQGVSRAAGHQLVAKSLLGARFKLTGQIGTAVRPIDAIVDVAMRGRRMGV